jgi:hypothetical protein
VIPGGGAELTVAHVRQSFKPPANAIYDQSSPRNSHQVAQLHLRKGWVPDDGVDPGPGGTRVGFMHTQAYNSRSNLPRLERFFTVGLSSHDIRFGVFADAVFLEKAVQLCDESCSYDDWLSRQYTVGGFIGYHFGAK